MLKSLDRRIEDLTHAIQEDSRAEINQLKSEARAKEAEILKAGREQAEKIRTAILEAASMKAAALREEKQAEVQLNARMRRLQKREELLSEVFSAARTHLTNTINSPEYKPALFVLTKEALQNLQTNPVILHFDSGSRSLITESDLSELTSSTKLEITMGDDLSSGIGVVAQDTKGHRVFDNTLEARFDRQVVTLRAQVFKILMGEQV
jgi:vacuolar-type H+-ATPase subunit E/Vma4